MRPRLREALSDALASRVTRAMPVSGGDVNDAYRVELADGRVVFLKTHARLRPEAFRVEARGLDWLREAGSLRIPEVVAVADEDSDVAFLALEFLESGRRRADFDETLGRGLATLHRRGSEGFGIDHDNYIGSLPQSNTPSGNWADFYRDRRLVPQVERAMQGRRFDSRTRSRFDTLFQRLPELLGPEERPSRLHGDLWGGNLHDGPGGEPCLIDPACYGGHREVDLAMMRLFGGFGTRVFDAYEEAFPLAPGHTEREPLYQLYPLLVHVNLFGGGYGASVLAVLGKYV